ncbi:MAG: hypothetical protein WBM08_01205 [Prochlorococcaceae cyanobacterium]
MHVAIDDATRLADVEALDPEGSLAGLPLGWAEISPLPRPPLGPSRERPLVARS